MKTALIFWGGWKGHEPEACSAILKDILEAEGFAVTRVEGTSVLTAQDPASFDLIVPLVTMSKIEKPEIAALEAAVRNGSGLAGYHGGMGDSFRECVEYQFMVGGQWVAHPGNIIDYRVDITKPDDPVVAGIGGFAYRSEQYYMHVDPSNEVLATTRFSGEHAPWIDGVVMPVAWKRKHGAGRVFYSSLGHVAAEFEVPQMREILRRGMVWAAR